MAGGQFGTNIIKTDNLAPGQFGTNIIKQTIWHRNFFGIIFIENIRVVLFVKYFQKVK